MWWVFKYIPVMNFMLGLPDWLTVLLTPSMQGFVDLRKTMTAQLEGILNDPTSLEHSEHEIIYHHLLTPKKGQTKIPSKKSLLEEAINLMLAGRWGSLKYLLASSPNITHTSLRSDTVGNASTVGTFHILNSPIVLQKLRNELHEAWPDKDTPMHFETLEKLPYLVRARYFFLHGVAIEQLGFVTDCCHQRSATTQSRGTSASSSGCWTSRCKGRYWRHDRSGWGMYRQMPNTRVRNYG